MLGDKSIVILRKGFKKLFPVGKLLHKLLKHRKIYLFPDARFFLLFRCDVCPLFDIHHHIGNDIYLSFVKVVFRILELDFDHNKRNRLILDLIGTFPCKPFAGLHDYLAVFPFHILCEDMSCDTVAERKLLCKFISSHMRKVITSCIKEHTLDKTSRIIYIKRLTGTQLLIKLKDTFIHAGGGILFHSSKKLRLFTKKIKDLGIRSESEGTQKNGDRYLLVPVDPYIKYIIGICFVF